MSAPFGVVVSPDSRKLAEPRQSGGRTLRLLPEFSHESASIYIFDFSPNPRIEKLELRPPSCKNCQKSLKTAEIGNKPEVPQVKCVKTSGIVVTNQCPADNRKLDLVLPVPVTFFGGAFGRFLLPSTGFRYK